MTFFFFFFNYFSKTISLDISCESTHMKCQDSLSLKNKNNVRISFPKILFGTLRVNTTANKYVMLRGSLYVCGTFTQTDLNWDPVYSGTGIVFIGNMLSWLFIILYDEV